MIRIITCEYNFQYLYKRFGKAARMAGSFAFTLQLLLYSGVVLYAPALALEATTGISTTASIIGIGLVCTFYSTIGGIKAVLITDVFQSLLMLIAIILVIITAAINVGGLDKIWEIARQGSRIEFDRWTFIFLEKRKSPIMIISTIIDRLHDVTKSCNLIRGQILHKGPEP